MRNRLAASAVLVMGLLAAAGTPRADYQGTLDALTRGLPPEVGALIHRIVDCNHWGGEEGYDEARTAEIVAAMDSLSCDVLDHDEAALRQRYGASPTVIRALDKAKELLF